MTDLKDQLAALLASLAGKAMIDAGRKFSTEELQAAFAQVLQEFDGRQRDAIEAAFNEMMARRAN